MQILITRTVIIGDLEVSDDPGKGAREMHEAAMSMIGADYARVHWNDKSQMPHEYSYGADDAKYAITIEATATE